MLTRLRAFIKRHPKLVILLAALALTGAFSFALNATRDEPLTPKQVQLATIVKEISDEKAAAKIKQVKIEDVRRNVTIVYKDKDVRSKTSAYPTDYGQPLLDAAEKGGAKVKVTNEFVLPGSGWATFLSYIPLILIIALILWLVISTTGGKGGNKPISKVPDVRFKDIAGVDEAVEDMGEITEFLKNTERFREIGAKAPRGALLAGPPGTGKTMIAKAVAGEAGVPFYEASGSDFVEMFVGLGARRVRTLFKAAKKHDRAIVFIDEIDTIGGKRGQDQGSESREHSRTINALLTEMDGFEASNVIVIAATNNPESLDEALVRAGRFDRKITVDLPDWKGREGILHIHAKGKPLGKDVDFTALAKSTTGLSGAELANLINEALINAVRNERRAAIQADFMEALSVVTLGRARTSAVITPHDRHITAIHEAGHAVVGMALDELPDPTHVTVVPRGMTGGHTKLQESEDRFQTATQLRARMAMMMGGLAAERIVLGDITQGPGSDLAVATNLAQQMVSKMGMGSSLSVVADQSIVVNGPVGEAIQAQAEKLLAEAVEKAQSILTDPSWSKVFEAMSQELLEVDALELEEIQRLKLLALEAK